MEAHETPAVGAVCSWPLAGSTEFGRTPLEWRNDLAARLQRILAHDIVAAWFPRIIDHEIGGFAQDFDRRWRPTTPDDRMLEYQARTTRAIARLGQAFPDDERWVEYARHGAAYLTDVMEDHVDGGWFWLVGRDGAPRALGTKHAHGTAYVISALVDVYWLTGDPAALEGAQEAFNWLDTTLHDDINGGYHGWSTRDGRPIMSRDAIAGWAREDDPLGHDIGLKDLNVHSDLLDSLRLLAEASPSAVLTARSAELYDIVQQRFTDERGSASYLVLPDLTRIDGPVHTGYAFQTSYRSVYLAAAAERPREGALAFASRVVDRALADAWDPRSDGVWQVIGDSRTPRKAWWIQCEALHAMILLEVSLGDGAHRQRIERLLELVEQQLIDARWGGFFEYPISEFRWRDRVRPTRLRKAYRWKDASHETEMCISGTRMLLGLPDRSRLDRGNGLGRD